MLLTVTDVQWSVCVHLSVCLLITTASPRQMAEPTEMPNVSLTLQSGNLPLD